MPRRHLTLSVCLSVTVQWFTSIQVSVWKCPLSGQDASCDISFYSIFPSIPMPWELTKWMRKRAGAGGPVNVTLTGCLSPTFWEVWEHNSKKKLCLFQHCKPKTVAKLMSNQLSVPPTPMLLWEETSHCGWYNTLLHLKLSLCSGALNNGNVH